MEEYENILKHIEEKKPGTIIEIMDKYESDLDTLNEAKIQTWCYTVNDPSRFKFLSKVDAVFTDFPDKFSAIN